MIALRKDYCISQDEKDYAVVFEKIRSLFYTYEEFQNAVAVRIKSMIEGRYEIPELSIGEVWTHADGVSKACRNTMEVFATAVDPHSLAESYLQYNDKDKSSEEREKEAAKISRGKFEMFYVVKIASDVWDDCEIGDKLQEELSFIVSQAGYECGMPKRKFKKIVTI